MNKRILVFLLLVSFAFNLAILGSFIYFRVFFGGMHCPPPPPPEFREGRPDFPHHEMWERLPIDEEMHQLRKDFGNKKNELMLELAKDPIDEAKINAILAESLTHQSSLERKLGDRLIQLRKTMTADEAKEFFGKRAEFMTKRNFDRIPQKDFRNKRRIK